MEISTPGCCCPPTHCRPPQSNRQNTSLFNDDQILNQYRYSAYRINLTLPPAEVWRLYRGGADAENRIKELKADFGFDSFNLNNFFGTEAALSITMLAYNLMALFRQYVLNSKIQHTLSTLWYKTFAIGAYFEKYNGKYSLRMALHRKRREWFQGLWASSKAYFYLLNFLMLNLG